MMWSDKIIKQNLNLIKVKKTNHPLLIFMHTNICLPHENKFEYKFD